MKKGYRNFRTHILITNALVWKTNKLAINWYKYYRSNRTVSTFDNMKWKISVMTILLAGFYSCNTKSSSQDGEAKAVKQNRLKIVNSSDIDIEVLRPYSLVDDQAEKIVVVAANDSIELDEILGVYEIYDGDNKIIFCYDQGAAKVRYKEGIIEVSGSKCHDDYLAYEQFRKSSLEKNVNGIRREIEALSGGLSDNKKEIDSLSALEMTAYKIYQNEITDYAIKMPKNPAFYYSSLRWIGDEHLPGLQTAVDEFAKQYAGTDLLIEMENKLERLTNIALGSKVEEFKGKGLNGDTILSKHIESKYLMIDLWASWCRPCRLEANHLNQLRQTYNTSDFEILGVSIDRDQEAWENAVKLDNREFPQIFDGGNYAGDLAQRFSVSAVPSNFILDENRTIIARNVYGAELDALLDSLITQ